MKTALFIFIALSYASAISSPIVLKRICRSQTNNLVYWASASDSCKAGQILSIYGRESVVFPFVKIDSNLSLSTYQYLHVGANNPSNKSWEYFIEYYKKCQSDSTLIHSDTILVDVTPPEITNLDSVSINPRTNSIMIGWQGNNSVDFNSYSLYNYNRQDPRLVENFTDTFFLDSGVLNPVKDILKYEITSVDSCGNRNAFGGNVHQPMLLTAKTDTCQRSITLNWSIYQGWKGVFKHYIFELTPTSETLIDSVSGTINQFTVSKLTPGITHIYYVRALKSDTTKHISTSSNATSSVPFFRVDPTKTKIDYVSVLGPQEIEILCGLESGVHYKHLILQHSLDSIDYETISILSPNQTKYIDYGSSELNKNYYKLISYDLCGNPSDTTETSGNILLKLGETIDTLYLSWTGYFTWNNGIKEYSIFKSTSPLQYQGGQFNELKSVAKNVFTIDYNISDSVSCYYVLATSADQTKVSKSNVVCNSKAGFIFAPNAISLSGANQVFNFLGQGYNPNNSQIAIYNNWGEEVYSSNTLYQGWSGIDNNNNPLPLGVYFYQAKISQNNSLIEKHGTITIIR